MAAQFRMLPHDPFPKHSDGACSRMLQALLRNVEMGLPDAHSASAWLCSSPVSQRLRVGDRCIRVTKDKTVLGGPEVSGNQSQPCFPSLDQASGCRGRICSTELV